MANNFSFNLPEDRKLTDFEVLKAAADKMRRDPFFEQRRKDGGLYKHQIAAQWLRWGSPETVLCAMTNRWALIITPAGHRRFDVRAFKSDEVGRAALQSLRALQHKAA